MHPDKGPGEDDQQASPERDEHQALSRPTGGVHDDDAPDQGSATGTTPNQAMVGRVQGQDVGYAGETGGERRAQQEAEQREP